MSRINNNVNSLIAQRILTQQNAGLSGTLEKLSTGLKINRGADGPAGLIASERLRADKEALNAAIGNAERANQIANVAEGALQEVSSLLLEVQGLVAEVANTDGLSTEEKEANQLQIDAILQTIDRISSTTSFGSTKLLNGNLDFTVTSVASTVADYNIRGAKIAEGGSIDVDVVVTESAQHAALFLSTDGALDLSAADATFTIEVAGAKGNRSFSFASGTTQADIATAINSFTSVTGVSATTQATGIMLKSTEFGSDQTISVNVLDDAGQDGGIYQVSSIDEDVVSTEAADTDFSAVASPITDDGQDVSAIVNGNVAAGKGRSIAINTDALSIDLELTTAGAQATGAISALTVSGGGAKFNIGAGVNVDNQVRLGLPNIAARNLGNATDGFLDSLGSGSVNNLVDGNIENAQTVVGKAIDQVAGLRGRLGAFQSLTVNSTLNSLNVALENTSAAESIIRDTDFASETANLTRNQILVQAATSALAISNSRPQSILQLIG